jgi:hypothetical protein
MIAASLGGGAAADEAHAVKAAAIVPSSLAGRWSGQHFASAGGPCAANGCALTYDIVACKEGWCGIAVKDDKTCGRIGVRLAGDAKTQGGDAFKGKLELAEGSAPYTVEAWYSSKKGEPSRLHFLGDTGSELLLMRRSFPFEADLERTGEATCTLEKATS